MSFDIMNVQVEMPKANINDYSWTIYGVPKVGKTSMCAYLFEDPLFFQFEQGQNAVKAKKAPVEDWKMFKNHIKTMKKARDEGKAMPANTAIIDTVDVATKMCTQYICRMNGWSDPSDGEWGAGWRAVADEWLMAMTELENLGMKPVYVAHEKDKEFKPKNKEKYNKVVPNVSGSIMDIIVGKVDMILYCRYDEVENDEGELETERRGYFRNNGDFESGSRLLYIDDYVTFQETPKQTADVIRDAFERAVKKEFGEEAEEPKPKPKKESKQTTKEEKPKKAEVKSESKEKPKEDPVKEDKEDSKPPWEDLGELKKELENKFLETYKSGSMKAEDLVALVKEHTGKDKVSAIDDIVGAKSLLEALK